MCLPQSLTLVIPQARDPEARDEGVLRQVQRPHLRQTGEAGHHDPPGFPGQHRSGPALGGIKGGCTGSSSPAGTGFAQKILTPAWKSADGSCCATHLLLLGRCPALAVAFLAARLLPSYPLWQVLAELKEYATEVDVDFVRKAVRAIGRCAIKVEVRAGPLGSPWQLGLGWRSPHPGAGTAPGARALLGLGLSHSCSGGMYRV